MIKLLNKFRNKLILSITILCVVLVLFTSIIHYLYTKQLINNNFNASEKIIDQMAVSQVKNIDMAYYSFEKTVEKDMLNLGQLVAKSYNKHNNFKRLNLKTFLGTNKNLNIYIIDKNNIIKYSTYKDDIGLNLNKFNTTSKMLHKIRRTKKPFSDRMNLSIKNKSIMKYCYVPTYDGKYIVEVGQRIQENSKALAENSFKTVEKHIVKYNSSVLALNVISSLGYEFGKTSNENTPIKVNATRLQWADKAIYSDKIFSYTGTYNGRNVLYKYIPYKLIDSNGRNNIAIELIFNRSILSNMLKSAVVISIIVILIAIILTVFISVILSNIVTKPINEIVHGMNEVSKNNFDYHIHTYGNDEFKHLADSLNNMISETGLLLKERNENISELNDMNNKIHHQKEEIEALYEETTALNEELYDVLDKMRDNYLYTVKALANAIEAKDKYTKGHCDRVTKYALKVAKVMNISEGDINNLEFACLLHDIGKIGVPGDIINKPGKLTSEEFEYIKQHPSIGYDIIKDVEFLKSSAEILVQHHERLDGRGYPRGLETDSINLLAQILSVADSFDAMTSSRPYRTSYLSTDQAIEELEKNKGTQFNDEIVNVFVGIIKKECLV